MSKKTVSYHKQTSGMVTTTQIVSVSVVDELDGLQLSMFAREDWIDAMERTIAKFDTFYPSDIALLCDVRPPHDNVIGPYYKQLMRSEKIKRTGQYRASPRELRNGGVEFEYQNIGVGKTIVSTCPECGNTTENHHCTHCHQRGQ